MSRSRVLLCTIGFGLVVLFAARGHGQSAGGAKVLLDRFAPPPIERGISPLTLHAPNSTKVAVHTLAPSLDRTTASGAHYLAGSVIVKFKDTVALASRLQAASAVSRSASLQTRPSYADFDIVKIDVNENAEAVARAFAARPDVEYAQPMFRVFKQLVPNDRYYPDQWNLPAIDMERAWDIQPGAGSAITVAVIDTGVAFTNATVRFHASAFSVDTSGDILPPSSDPSTVQYPALGDLTLSFVAATELLPSTRFVAPFDFVWGDNLPIDLDGHGTHVSGTLGQLTNNGTGTVGDTSNGGGTAGVAFNVKIMPVKVLASEWDVIFGGAPEVGGTEADVARGIRYAADSGANVINMSLGSSGPAGSAPVIEDAMKYAVGKGVFIAVAGGNDFTDGNPNEVISEIASRLPGAVSVAAVNKNKGHTFYSSTGGYIELAAPGGEFGQFGNSGGILQQTLDLDLVETFTLPPSQFTAPRFDSLAYFYFIGTSQATPHVSGVAAMMMQQGIKSPAAVEAALERFAVPCSESANTCSSSTKANRNDTFGFGLVEARDSLRGLGLAR
jgi:serine protease